MNPEFGRNSGAILDAVTKSGTNQFHGSAFEYYRDTFMNARNYFSTITPPFHQNQFGGTLGGPAIKDKLFGFFSYQGTRAFQGQANSTPVFSQAQQGGDWGAGAFATATTRAPVALFSDPVGPCPVAGGVQCAANTTPSTLFSSGAIPTQDFNPISTNLITKFVPLPNGPGNTFQFSNNTRSSANQYIGRADYNLRSSDTLYAYVFDEKSDDVDAALHRSNVTWFRRDRHLDDFAVHRKLHSIFNPTTVNELRLTYNRFNFGAVNPQTPILPSALGFTGINPQDPAALERPTLG